MEYFSILMAFFLKLMEYFSKVIAHFLKLMECASQRSQASKTTFFVHNFFS